MSTDKELIMTIDVLLDDFLSIEGKVNMIGFHGRAYGKYFNGDILPCGVDTQMEDEEGRWTLSARYMIEGTDAGGRHAKIFVVNMAIAGEEYTRPRILTDSQEIMWLEKASLIGVLEDMEGGVRIKILQNKGNAGM